LVIPRPATPQEPIFRVVDSHRITLDDMDMFTLLGGGIVLEGSKIGLLKDVDIYSNRIFISSCYPGPARRRSSYSRQ
jgi:hypothetical protein